MNYSRIMKILLMKVIWFVNEKDSVPGIHNSQSFGTSMKIYDNYSTKEL